jgi:isochorismate synthase
LEEIKGNISLSYRFPNSNKVFTFSAQRFYYINNINEVETIEGFVFAPFDKNNKSVFILQSDLVLEENIKIIENKGVYDFLEISKEDYIQKGEKVIQTILNENFEKIVFSRVVKCKNVQPNRIINSYKQLLQKHLNTFVYFISIENFGTWFGATPEKLVTLNNDVLETVALAGTKSSNDCSEWKTKEIEEQVYVADYVYNNFKKLGLSPLKSERYTLEAGAIKHLCNSFSVSKSNLKLSDFIQCFHPTPAVAGVPKKSSIEYIISIENQDRAFYAGYLGVILHNDTKIFVNLRCANYQNNEVNIFVGGGYTKDSDVESEWLETINKSKTILDTLK